MVISNIIHLAMLLVTIAIAFVIPIYLEYRKAQHALLSVLNELNSNAQILNRFKVSGKGLEIIETRGWDNFRDNHHLLKAISKDKNYIEWFMLMENTYAKLRSRQKIADDLSNQKKLEEIKKLKDRLFELFIRLLELSRNNSFKIIGISLASDSVLKPFQKPNTKQDQKEGIK